MLPGMHPVGCLGCLGKLPGMLRSALGVVVVVALGTPRNGVLQGEEW